MIGPTQDSLNERTANSYSFGPLLSWSFPNILGAHKRIAQASGRADAALATFDKTVLNALQEPKRRSPTTPTNSIDATR